MLGADGQDFANLTPVNLLVSGCVLWANHKSWNTNIVLGIAIAGILGFFMEVAGVQTGAIFGLYAYGPPLGWGAFDVPFTMALNWSILIYCTAVVAQMWSEHWLWRASIGATLMVTLDYFIEPVAIHFNFWRWETPEVPLQNYVAWWIIAFVIHLIFDRLAAPVSNKIAPWLFIVQLLFFAGIGFSLQ